MDMQAQQELHDLMVEVISKGFQHVKTMVGSERLYGFALNLTQDGRSFSCAGNTLDGVSKKFMVKLKSIEDVTDYLWFSSEWDYHDFLLKNHKEVLDDFKAQGSLFNTNDIWNDAFFKVLMDALKTCNQKGLFGVGILREKIAVFIDSDNSDLFGLAEETSEILNPPYVHEAFLKRFDPTNPQGLTYRLINELVADY